MHVTLAIFLVLSSVLILANGSSLLDWHKFKYDHNKHYASVAEETERKEIFFQNVNRMRVYQQMHPNATFKLAISHLTDRRIEELISHSKLHISVPPTTLESTIESKDLPDSLDWRTKDVITPVKSPGLLDTDDAIAAVELVESLHAIQTKTLEIGSVARLDDCCKGPAGIFQCISNLSGICREDEYPRPTWLCRPNQCEPFAHFDTIKVLEIPNEDSMVTWIQDSPLFVGFDGNTTSFQSYSSGIYQDTTCSTTKINLSMQLVGYGKTDSGELYWLCKNSWGRGWGEKGYIRILRGINMCGIASQVIQIA